MACKQQNLGGSEKSQALGPPLDKPGLLLGASEQTTEIHSSCAALFSSDSELHSFLFLINFA